MAMKKCFIFVLLLFAACQPKPVTPITSLIGKIWKAESVKQNTTLVYTMGNASNIQPGYSRFRLDLRDPAKVIFQDVDGRTITGTWTVSTTNDRLILESLTPAPSNTNGIIEFYILAAPTDANLQLQRTAESRKTGNSINEYVLIPE